MQTQNADARPEPAPARDPDREFYDGLVRHRLIIPGGVRRGVRPRRGVRKASSRRSTRWYRPRGGGRRRRSLHLPAGDRPPHHREASTTWTPFPTCAGRSSASSARSGRRASCPGAIHAGEPWGDASSMTQVVLNPAACYRSIRPSPAASPGEGGRLVTMLNWVFRHEPSLRADRACSRSGCASSCAWATTDDRGRVARHVAGAASSCCSALGLAAQSRRGVRPLLRPRRQDARGATR